MKKIITYVLAALLAVAVAAPSAMAAEHDAATQEEIDSLRQSLELANQELNLQKLDAKYKQIWNKGKYTMLGYALQDMGTEFTPVLKSKYAFFISKGTTYYFPKRPIGGLVKIGLDMRWTDISVARFEDEKIASDNWDVIGGDNGDGDDDSGILDRFNNLGRWCLQASAFGVGVNVGVAPLSMFDNAAKYLRASVYFHYLPTFGAILVSEDGETEAPNIDWMAELERDRKGTIKSTAKNIICILENDPALSGHLWHDLFSGFDLVKGGLPWDKKAEQWGNRRRR